MEPGVVLQWIGLVVVAVLALGVLLYALVWLRWLVCRFPRLSQRLTDVESAVSGAQPQRKGWRKGGSLYNRPPLHHMADQVIELSKQQRRQEIEIHRLERQLAALEKAFPAYPETPQDPKPEVDKERP